jgi:hypothetical protein
MLLDRKRYANLKDDKKSNNCRETFIVNSVQPGKETATVVRLHDSHAGERDPHRLPLVRTTAPGGVLGSSALGSPVSRLALGRPVLRNLKC